jgi:transcription antitermination factor NusG
MALRRIDTGSFRWVALRVAAKSEMVVVDELQAGGFAGYCPVGQRWFAWGYAGKRPRAVRIFPVFSRYVFCGLAVGQVASRYMVDKVDAVLGDKKGPIFVPPGVVKRINELELAGEWDATRSWREKLPYKHGSRVSLTAGAFMGFPATVDEIDSEQRLWLLIDLFGRRTRIAANPASVAVACH